MRRESRCENFRKSNERRYKLKGWSVSTRENKIRRGFEHRKKRELEGFQERGKE